MNDPLVIIYIILIVLALVVFILVYPSVREQERSKSSKR